MPNTIVFTDLDGTLLDHETYSYAAAQPALDLLKAQSFPLVLASSKTAAEIVELRAELGFAHCPAIVENGSGVLEPFEDPDAGSEAVADYVTLRNEIDQLPKDLRACFKGFGDMSATRVAELTGLKVEKAERAKRRFFSEPGVWTGSDEQLADFAAHLDRQGISAIRGGRFLTLTFGADKAARMREITDRYRIAGAPPFVIALGDAPNDIEMLEAADIGVIIANPGHAPLPPLKTEHEGRIRRSAAAGPEGWNRSLIEILETGDSVPLDND